MEGSAFSRQLIGPPRDFHHLTRRHLSVGTDQRGHYLVHHNCRLSHPPSGLPIPQPTSINCLQLYQILFLVSFPSFSLPDVLCDPTDIIIWRKGTPFVAMTGRTAPSSDGILAEVLWVFSSAVRKMPGDLCTASGSFHYRRNNRSW